MAVDFLWVRCSCVPFTAFSFIADMVIIFPVFVVRSLAGIETIPFVSSQVVAGC